MSALLYSLMVILNKKAENISGMENSCIQLLVSFITVAVISIINTGFAFEIPKEGILWIAVIGFVNTGIGCCLYFSSIGKLPVQTVAVLGYSEPAAAVIFSLIFLQEKMTAWQIAGAVMIIGGAIIGECFSKIKIAEQS